MQEANLCINNVENKQEVINCSFFFLITMCKRNRGMKDKKKKKTRTQGEVITCDS